MLELKVKRFIDNGAEYGGPPVDYLLMAWIPAEPQTTREEYFYLFNEYEGGDDLNINPSKSVAGLSLRLLPLNESAQALIDHGAIEVRHDTLIAPNGAWEDSTETLVEDDGTTYHEDEPVSGATRVTESFEWYTPNGVMTIGDLPIGSTDDTTQMCRFDIRVTNLASDDVIGQSYFLITPDFAIPNTSGTENGSVYDIPVYDEVGYDGGGAYIDFSDIYLDSSILVEVFLMDRNMQELYEDFGIELMESYE